MDLNYGAEYEDFRKEVQAFCKEYQGVSFKSESNDNNMSDALNGSSATKKSKKEVTRSEWQQILIEKGYKIFNCYFFTVCFFWIYIFTKNRMAKSY